MPHSFNRLISTLFILLTLMLDKYYSLNKLQKKKSIYTACILLIGHIRPVVKKEVRQWQVNHFAY